MKYVFAVVMCSICTIQAAYADALVTSPVSQSITLSVPTEVRVGDVQLQATATVSPSGYTATLAVLPESRAVCSIDEHGFLTFLTVGTCTVVATQVGDEQYMPTHADVTITVREQLLGEIHGCVFDDVNENGGKDNGELGIQGLQVQMKMPDSSIRGSDSRTDSDGCYVFSGLGAGTYTDFLIEAGQELPNGDIVEPPFIFDQAGAFSLGTVTLATNVSVITEANFGGKRRGRVAGAVSADTNEDTVRDADEVLIGWTVTATPVLESNETPPPRDPARSVHTTITTVDGYEFIFGEEDVGLWMIQIAPPAGWSGSLTGPAYTLVDVQSGTDAGGLDVQLAPYVAAGVPSGGGDGEVDKGVIVFTAGPPVVVPAPQSGGNGPIVGSGFGPTTVGIAAGGSSTEPSQTFALVSVPTSTPTSAGEAIHPEEHAGVVAGVSTFKFLTNMGYDSRLTPDVHELHAILIQEGYLHISAPTGYFGPLTFAAVKRYQQAHGIMRSGYVGITTRESLNAR